MTSQTETVPAGTITDRAAVACVVAEEQRSAVRIAKSISVVLTESRGDGGHSCVASDISESGVYLRVASEVGLAVGQRCEVRFSGQPTIPELASLNDESCYATVVRTERINGMAAFVVGAGLRFDQPLFL